MIYFYGHVGENPYISSTSLLPPRFPGLGCRGFSSYSLPFPPFKATATGRARGAGPSATGRDGTRADDDGTTGRPGRRDGRDDGAGPSATTGRPGRRGGAERDDGTGRDEAERDGREEEEEESSGSRRTSSTSSSEAGGGAREQTQADERELLRTVEAQARVMGKGLFPVDEKWLRPKFAERPLKDVTKAWVACLWTYLIASTPDPLPQG